VGALASSRGVLFLVADWPPGEEDAPAPAGVIPASEVVEDPERYLPREVTVLGVVGVLEDRMLSFDGEYLILVSVGAPTFEDGSFHVKDPVCATGTLRMMGAADVRELLLDSELIPSAFQGFDREPVLLTTEVVPAPGAQDESYGD
jgi:hypothetical protein